mmetsp:Transcript_127963/g.239377  ORF Transcript_127963/g.239377 Transcript_127963/m.239377 type:complete len:275 (+) Transcript_127963:111-935(+)
MRHLLTHILAVIPAAVAAVSESSDDVACATSAADKNHCGGHRSLIQRHTVHELAHEVPLMPIEEMNNISVQLWDILLNNGYLGNGPLEELNFPEPILAQQVIDDLTQAKVEARTICETGFYGGHSALSLLSLTSARIYEFDLCRYNFSAPASAFLYNTFPGRFNLTCGNSTEQVPIFRKGAPDVRCDVIIADGGKTREEVRADLVNLGAMSNKNARVYLAGTPCPSKRCDGPYAAWDQLVEDGCIKSESRKWTREDYGFSHGTLNGCSDLQVGP